MARSRREARSVDIWPGFVDALSTLLMAITFLLVVYVLTQFLMSRLLAGRTEDLGRLQLQVQDLTKQLGIERDSAAELRRNATRLSQDLQAALGARDDSESQLRKAEADRDQAQQHLTLLGDEQRLLQRTLEEMRSGRTSAEQQAASLQQELEQARQMVTADRAKLEVQLGQLVQLRRDIEALGKVRDDLNAQVASSAAALEAARSGQAEALKQLGEVRDQSSALEGRLASAEERTQLAQKELADRELRIEELMRSSRDLAAAKDEASASQAEAQARVDALNKQILALSDQLRQLDAALGLKETQITSQGAKIAELGQRLNVALANKVEELTQFRSEFFGRLRQVLGDRDDVRIAGDRFVFQSEVLFGSGEAELNAVGKEQLTKLAATLKEVIGQIPSELPWVLQVDGHTDARPINTARFPSNWELSTARAISVAEFLVSQGIPASRVAAAGFGEFQPLDPGSTEEAYRRNRRIEIKLTTR